MIIMPAIAPVMPSIKGDNPAIARMNKHIPPIRIGTISKIKPLYKSVRAERKSPIERSIVIRKEKETPSRRKKKEQGRANMNPATKGFESTFLRADVSGRKVSWVMRKANFSIYIPIKKKKRNIKTKNNVSIPSSMKKFLEY